MAHSSAISWALFIPLGGPTVGSLHDFCSRVCPKLSLSKQETLDSHGARHKVIENCDAGDQAGRGVCPLLSPRAALPSPVYHQENLVGFSLPSPGPAVYQPLHPSLLTCLFFTPGLPALPSPPLRPLQEPEGTRLGSFLTWPWGPHATHLLPQVALDSRV